MTTLFLDFKAEQDARNTIELNVTKWCYMLTDALRQNFIDYSIDSHQKTVSKLDDFSPDWNYQLKKIAELKNGECNLDFSIESGRKYHKIVMNDNGNHYVHAFVDRRTGEVYKPAGCKSPAKGVRFDLRIIEQREWLLKNADWAGGYLYIR